MIEEIKNRLDSPVKLETLFRENKSKFKQVFEILYPEIQNQLLAQYWRERLHHERPAIQWGTKLETSIIIFLSILSALVANIPLFTGINDTSFYLRNMGFLFLPMLAIYFSWKENVPRKHTLIILLVLFLSIVYINVIPSKDQSDTLLLACIHMPLLIWALTGYTFTGDQFSKYSLRIDFLKYNGELLVMSTILLLAGGLFTGITVGLFELINISLESYIQYIAFAGLASVPVFSTYLIKSNPHLVKSISPIVARVFTPLVLGMLFIYLGAIIFTGKDPYNDREFLLVFNILLIGVMAIILFACAETTQIADTINMWLLFTLSLVTILLNGIALSAIIFRISEWGITPNRLAVLGANVLVLTNLMMVSYQLFRSIQHADMLETVEKNIAIFLPVYWGWTVIVVFIFPLVFSFT